MLKKKSSLHKSHQKGHIEEIELMYHRKSVTTFWFDFLIANSSWHIKILSVVGLCCFVCTSDFFLLLSFSLFHSLTRSLSLCPSVCYLCSFRNCCTPTPAFTPDGGQNIAARYTPFSVNHVAPARTHAFFFLEVRK